MDQQTSGETSADSAVPDIVVARLPIYLRALATMQAGGKQYTSSQEMADLLGISSAQIRKDLSHFGEFGKQGTGYSINELHNRLRHILNLEQDWNVIVIGAGHIGSAVASYSGFEHRGFRVAGIFDNDPRKVGLSLGQFQVIDIRDLAFFVRQNQVQLAMITVPAQYAQAVADQCVAAGIRGILNYAPVNLSVPDHVNVQNIDPVLHLQHMTYYL
jgi:redox-sensing transcriptional repressor